MDRASPSPRLPRASRDALLNCQELDQVSRPEVLSGNASKLIQREIIYRLLQGSLGARLRAIATFETKCHRTTKAVAWLRSNYEKPLRVQHLATIAGMSRSTLHLHFRALTAMSPLQFQKQLRLHAARQRMLAGDLDAASAAFQVGYESPSQFNRRVQAILWPAPNSRYQGRARRQSRGDHYRLTLNCWVAMARLVLNCRKLALSLSAR